MSSRRESGGVDRTAEREAAGLTIDENSPYQEMAVVEKFERFINYIYPILQRAPRAHGIARDAMLRALFDQVELLKIAGKSGNASRLYSADAQLSLLRFYLRFMVHSSRKIITPHQHQVAQVHMAEVGRMIGGWIKTVKSGVVRDK